MSKGKQLLDDFLNKLDISMTKAREQNVITLDDLQPVWEARERLEAYLDPPRDKQGHFMKATPLSTDPIKEDTNGKA